MQPSIYSQEEVITVDSTVIQNRLEYIEYLQSLIDTNKIKLDLTALPESVFQNVDEVINVKDIDARDFLRGLGRQYNVNIIVDNRLNRRFTFRLSQVSVIEILIQVVQENNLTVNQKGQIFRVREYVEPVSKPIIVEPTIRYENNLLTVDLQEVSIADFTRKLTQLTGKNIIIRNGISGSITGYLNDVEFETGLANILINNGFSLRENNQIYVVDRIGYSSDNTGSGGNFWITVNDGLVSMDVVDANATDIIREIGYQSKVNMITYGLPKNTITAKVNNLTIDQILTYIFRGTSFTYRKEGEIYIIGDKSTSGIASNKLIRLNHLRSDVLVDLLPKSVINNASVEVIKEQNGLMVIGTNDVIVELETLSNKSISLLHRL